MIVLLPLAEKNGAKVATGEYLYSFNNENYRIPRLRPSGHTLSLLVTILSQSFFSFVRSHFMAFSFLSARHSV